MPPQNKRKTEPDLCAVLDQVKDQVMSELNCVSIGTIVSFDSSDQTATIQLSYKKINLYDGSISDYQPLIKCPCIILNGGGGYLTFPITAGDSCLVLFCDREIDTWFTNGGTNPPQSARVHDLNDGIALVGIRNGLNSLKGYYQGGIQLTTPGKFIFNTGMLSFKMPLDNLCQNLIAWASGAINTPTFISDIQFVQSQFDSLFDNPSNTMNNNTVGSKLAGSVMMGG